MCIISDSLIDLNHHLAKKVTMDRFRPNIVIDGASPWDEDHWKTIKITTSVSSGSNDRVEFNMDVVKPCSRCTIPDIDPQTAIPDPNREPSKSMRNLRTGKAIGYSNKKWAGEVSLIFEVHDY